MTDPLANVERLLSDAMDCASEYDLRTPQHIAAREAVRLLLEVARLHVAVTVDLKEHAGLLAFARSLAGDPR